MSEIRATPVDTGSANTSQGTTAQNAGGAVDQALVAAIAAAVQTKIDQLTGNWNDRLNSLESRLKQTTIDDDIATEISEIGSGDPMDRAERQRNSRDRNDFYRDALQSITVSYLASMRAREADRYSASEPSPLPINKRAGA